MYYWRIYNFVTEMRFAVRKSTAFVKNKKRKHCKINVSASYMRAADGNRTRDLRTACLVGSEMCIRDRILTVFVDEKKLTQNLRKVKYKQM